MRPCIVKREPVVHFIISPVYLDDSYDDDDDNDVDDGNNDDHGNVQTMIKKRQKISVWDLSNGRDGIMGFFAMTMEGLNIGAVTLKRRTQTFSTAHLPPTLLS